MKDFFKEVDKLPIEKIMEIDLERNNPGTDLQPRHIMLMASQMMDQGWEIKRFNNTLIFTKDEDDGVLFHTMTAENAKDLQRSVVGFYLYELGLGKKLAYTYFDNPAIIRLLQMKGAEKVVESDNPTLGKYKAFIDLPAVLKAYQKMVKEQ
jgi:hypothetical protein